MVGRVKELYQDLCGTPERVEINDMFRACREELTSVSWVGGEIVGGGGRRQVDRHGTVVSSHRARFTCTDAAVRTLFACRGEPTPPDHTARSHHMPTAVDRPRRIYRRARAGAEVCSLSDPTITVRGRFAGQSTRQTIGLAVGVKGGIVAR